MKSSERSAFAASVLCAAALWAGAATAGEGPNVAHGKTLVEANCARCHAIGHADNSPHPQAPEFRTLSQHYPIDALEEAFVEGIFTGHPDMPQFRVTPQQVADIIAFIETLQP